MSGRLCGAMGPGGWDTGALAHLPLVTAHGLSSAAREPAAEAAVVIESLAVAHALPAAEPLLEHARLRLGDVVCHAAEWAAQLAQCPPFQHCSPAALLRAVPHLRYEALRAGAELCDDEAECSVIVSGAADLAGLAERSPEHRLGPGWVLGGDAFLRGVPLRCRVTAAPSALPLIVLRLGGAAWRDCLWDCAWDALLASPLARHLAALPHAAREQLAHCVGLARVAPGATLLAEGSRGRTCVVLCQGVAVAYRAAEAAAEGAEGASQRPPQLDVSGAAAERSSGTPTGAAGVSSTRSKGLARVPSLSPERGAIRSMTSISPSRHRLQAPSTLQPHPSFSLAAEPVAEAPQLEAVLASQDQQLRALLGCGAIAGAPALAHGPTAAHAESAAMLTWGWALVVDVVAAARLFAAPVALTPGKG